MQQAVVDEAQEVALLTGEGERKFVMKVRQRRECAECGEPATKKLMFCYINGRRDPRSSMYGRDDCSFCSDYDAFSCSEHGRLVEREHCPDGMNWGGTFSSGGRYDHMLLKWTEREISRDALLAELAKDGAA